MRFTKLHQWVDEVEPGIFRIGLSSFAIKELGEVVYIDFLKNPGETVENAEPLAEIESLKSVNYFQSPFAGEIMEVNVSLQKDTSTVNRDSESTGWLFSIKITENTNIELMDEKKYREFAIAT